MKFCSNCGKEIDEKAIVCLGCGVALNPKETEEDTTKQKRGKGIASMVLGIVSILLALLILIGAQEAIYGEIIDSTAERIGFAFGYSMIIQLIPAIIGLCLAVSERSKFKNGFNTAGLWLTLSTMALCVITFIAVLVML